MSECKTLSMIDPTSIPLSPERILDNALAYCGHYSRAIGRDAPPRKASAPAKIGPRRSPPRKQVTPDKVLQAFNTWAFKREHPTEPLLMLQIIAEAIALEEPIQFVLYWGKGPRSAIDRPDIECLDFLASFARRVREAFEPGAAIKLIFTDTHAQLNGHPPAGIRVYCGDIETAAGRRGFDACRLSELTRAADAVAAGDPIGDDMPEHVTLRLFAGAKRWYRGEESAEHGALKYYRMNMIEKRAVELAFPRAIFITFSGSHLRCLFPARLPIFYMYSMRRGTSVKPWFLAAESAP
jgi:hypothetical protein